MILVIFGVISSIWITNTVFKTKNFEEWSYKHYVTAWILLILIIITCLLVKVEMLGVSGR